MRLHVFAYPMIALSCLTSATVFGQSSAQKVAEGVEQEDERFDQSLRNFGWLAGAAYQCTSEADRATHDRDVLKAYSGVVRLFGTDRAFYYAAAFGAGTSMSLDKTKCPMYLEDFKAAMKSGNIGR